MLLKQVKIKNFRGYGTNPNRADGFYIFDNLDSNFVLLSGYNGFGKTSFFEAIEWCLTDKIRRLEKFEDNYHVNELKKAQYLKFHKLNQVNQEERKIEVEVMIDDNLKVYRSSSSLSPFAGNGDNYDSDLKVYYNNNEIEAADNSMIFRLLIPNIEDLTNELQKCTSKNFKKEIKTVEDKYADTLLSANMLTQENLSSFLRSTDPLQRRSMFMKLLGLSEIDSLYNKVGSLRRGRNFSNKKREINDKAKDISDTLNGINDFFRIKNLGSIEEFILSINNKFNEFIEFVTGKSDETFATLRQSLPVSMENYAKILFETENQKEKLLKNNEQYQKTKIELTILKDEIKRITVLQMGFDIYNKIEQSELLKEVDYSNVATLEVELTSKSEGVEESKKKNAEKISQLYKLEVDSASYFGKLDDNTTSIKEELWESVQLLGESISKLNDLFNENMSIDGDYGAIDFEGISNIQKLKPKYEDLTKQIRDLNTELIILEREHKTRSNVNEQYFKMLTQVREFIVTKSEDISECPVCLNTAFIDISGETSTANKIISIINNSISLGSGDLERIAQQITDLMVCRTKLIETTKIEVIDEIRKELQSLMSIYNDHFDKIMQHLMQQKILLDAEEDNYKKQKASLIETKKRYEECYKKIFGTPIVPIDINKEKLLNNLEKITEAKDKWYQEHYEMLGFSYIPTKEEIEQSLKYILKKDVLEKYYPGNIEGLREELKGISGKIEYATKLIAYLDEILEMKLNDNYLPKLQKYFDLQQDQQQLTNSFQKIEEFEENIKKIHDNLSRVQKGTVENQLSNHPIITWIYESINPHPFYNKLVITSEESGTNFKNENSEIYLDQIFSSAQLNILALSIFLGLGMSQEYSNLKQLFLDDPIQSMDDVNILAFIDVLRAILDSQSKHKKIILSTHDDNFAKLLSIKMRNRSFVEYKFVSYGEEGPIIERQIN